MCCYIKKYANIIKSNEKGFAKKIQLNAKKEKHYTKTTVAAGVLTAIHLQNLS